MSVTNGITAGTVTSTFFGSGYNLSSINGANVQGIVSNAMFANTVGSITSGQVTNALGYIPYDSSNPSGYLTVANFNPSVTGNGYCYLPGGLLMQWGRDTTVTNRPLSLYTTNFPIPFSSTPFSVTIGRITTTLQQYNQKFAAEYIYGRTNTYFQWCISDDDSADPNSYYYGHSWFAIGPA